MLNKIMAEQKILNQLLKNKNNKEVLYKWLKCELSYTSNAIEGNTLTRRETALVIEEHFTSSSKPFVHYQEAVNHAKAFLKIIELIKNNSPISLNVILNLHKIIFSGIDDDNAGLYRHCNVQISHSKTIFPSHIKVPKLMEDFIAWLKKQDLSDPTTAILSHLKLVSIHPFIDGNGRSARLLMNLLLLQAGFAPIIVQPRDRKKYLSTIEEAQITQENSEYINYMLSLLLRSTKRIINMLDINKPDATQDDILTISAFAALVGVPNSSIRYWVENNKLKPYSYTDSGYMLFAKCQAKEAKALKNTRTK